MTKILSSFLQALKSVGPFNSLPSWFLATPAGAEATSQAVDQKLTEREGLLSEIERVTTEHAQEIEPVGRALLDARKRADRTAAAARDAKAELQELERRVQSLTWQRDSHVNSLRAQLRATADPAITAAIDHLRNAWEETRHTRWDTVSYGGRDINGQPVGSASNYASILARMDAIRAAINQAESLKLESLNREGLVARLTEIFSGIPEIAAASTFVPDGEVLDGPKDQAWVNGPGSQ